VRVPSPLTPSRRTDHRTLHPTQDDDTSTHIRKLIKWNKCTNEEEVAASRRLRYIAVQNRKISVGVAYRVFFCGDEIFLLAASVGLHKSSPVECTFRHPCAPISSRVSSTRREAHRILRPQIQVQCGNSPGLFPTTTTGVPASAHLANKPITAETSAVFVHTLDILAHRARCIPNPFSRTLNVFTGERL
jgi:hypothetical protein